MRCARRQRGFGAIAAVVILVLLAGMGVYLLNIGMAQHAGVAVSARANQAWFAARAGGEWATARLDGGADCATLSAATPFEVLGYTVSLDDCTAQLVDEAGGSETIVRLQVTATAGTPGQDRVARTVVATVRAP